MNPFILYPIYFVKKIYISLGQRNVKVNLTKILTTRDFFYHAGNSKDHKFERFLGVCIRPLSKKLLLVTIMPIFLDVDFKPCNRFHCSIKPTNRFNGLPNLTD